MTVESLVEGAQWFFLVYFLGLSFGYLALDVLSLITIYRYMAERTLEDLSLLYDGFELPVSILVPAHNEEATIVTSMRSLLQLNYSEFEVVVVNDGSSDGTLGVLIEEFALRPFPEAYRVRLATQPVRGVYRSQTHRKLRVVDKANGGKADALNAGINLARYPLFCGIDADSILQQDSLRRVARPFIEDPATVACGGIVRIANGCRVRDGFFEKAGLPGSLLALFQIVEYLRAFLFGRMGWTPLNGVLIISGAFGLFRKETVIEAGGYRTDTVGEDMELILRLHRLLIRRDRPYRIRFIPDPICWTEAPEDLRTLMNQRVRWQRGLAESLWFNRSLLFAPHSGAAGWLAFPFMLVFEFFGPIIEAAGYVFVGLAFWLNIISWPAAIAFLIVAVGLGLLLSVVALLLEEISFHIYGRIREVLLLFLMVVLENLGYRQMNTVWRVVGLFLWGFKIRSRWGRMVRRAAWKTN